MMIMSRIVRIIFSRATRMTETVCRYKLDNPSHNQKGITVNSLLMHHSKVQPHTPDTPILPKNRIR